MNPSTPFLHPLKGGDGQASLGGGTDQGSQAEAAVRSVLQGGLADPGFRGGFSIRAAERATTKVAGCRIFSVQGLRVLELWGLVWP